MAHLCWCGFCSVSAKAGGGRAFGWTPNPQRYSSKVSGQVYFLRQFLNKLLCSTCWAGRAAAVSKHEVTQELVSLTDEEWGRFVTRRCAQLRAAKPAPSLGTSCGVSTQRMMAEGCRCRDFLRCSFFKC